MFALMLQRLLALAEKSADLICDLRRYPAGEKNPPPMIVAHRGAWDLADCFENTLRAFTKACEQGAHAIEFDVHFTADIIPVVHHDGVLGRIFKHPGVLESMTLKELRSVTGDLPTLADVLALRELHFMIEIKVAMDQARIESLIECLGDLDAVKDFHLLAIDPALVRIHPRLPKEAWILVGELDLRSRVNLSIEKGYGGVAGHYLGMRNGDIQRLHASGQKAGTGFVPTKNILCRERARGVDYVFSNSIFRLF